MESPIAEGIVGLCLVGDKCGDMWGQGFGLFVEESYVLCLEFEATFG